MPIDSNWAKDGLGCEAPLRRLNIWGPNAGAHAVSYSPMLNWDRVRIEKGNVFEDLKQAK